MTHDEVTAAMKAEVVDAALVERAAQAAYEINERSVGTLELHPWSDVIEDHKEAWRVMARHVLAAVQPEIQAQALLDFAGPEGGDLEPHEFRDAANWGAWKARQAARYEAARLTAATEEPTT